MKTTISIAAWLSTMVMGISLQAGQPEIPPSVDMTADIVFAAPGGRELRLDLFRAKTALNPTPAVIFIHGEKTGRDKSHYRRLAADVAARGLVTASIDYRGPVEASFPAAIDDAQAAVEWMNKNAAEYGVLPGAVAAAGEGFGGYVAAMLGVATSERGPRVDAVIPIHGVLDLARYEPIGSPTYAYEFHMFLGYPRVQRPDVWDRASPLRHVDKRSVPFLFAHVDGQRIPISQSNAMLTALKSAGVRAELFSPSGVGNALVDAPDQVQGLARSVANFVKEVLWRPPVEVRAVQDVVYANPEGRDVRLDLFLPAARTARAPGVLFFHGGGWAWGDRTIFREECVYLARRGFVTACVEYRLSRERIYPAAVDDAKAAVRWMRANAAKYGIDPDRIAAVGTSAGGHLASMLGVTPEKRSFERADDHPGVSSKVTAVVAISAVVDVLGFDRLDPYSARTFIGGRPNEMPARYTEASPTTYVGPTSAPFLFMHGTADSDVAYAEAALMRKKLEDAGVRAEMFTADGGEHDFFWNYRWRQTAIQRLENFLRSALAPR